MTIALCRELKLELWVLGPLTVRARLYGLSDRDPEGRVREFGMTKGDLVWWAWSRDRWTGLTRLLSIFLREAHALKEASHGPESP